MLGTTALKVPQNLVAPLSNEKSEDIKTYHGGVVLKCVPSMIQHKAFDLSTLE